MFILSVYNASNSLKIRWNPKDILEIVWPGGRGKLLTLAVEMAGSTLSQLTEQHLFHLNNKTSRKCWIITLDDTNTPKASKETQQYSREYGERNNETEGGEKVRAVRMSTNVCSLMSIYTLENVNRQCMYKPLQCFYVKVFFKQVIMIYIV